jgi:hypothetical protein
MTETLDQRIDAALAENITPDALMRLIADTEAARIALNPIASPDIRRAQASVEIAFWATAWRLLAPESGRPCRQSVVGRALETTTFQGAEFWLLVVEHQWQVARSDHVTLSERRA